MMLKNHRLVSLHVNHICCKTKARAYSIFAYCQHGFWSQLSYETQLVQFVHDIISSMDGAVHRRHKQKYLIIMAFA